MGIQIDDPNKALSKHQVQKIKTRVSKFLETNPQDNDILSFLQTNILGNINILDEKKRYNTISFEKQEHLLIQFGVESKKDDLRNKLRQTLKMKNSFRKISDDTESKLWKTYAHFKKYAQKGINVPTPTEIKNQPQLFEQLIQNMPDSDFKSYIQDCIV